MSKANSLLVGLMVCLLATSVHADDLCFSPVKKKKGDTASERPWWKPFDYRVQVDDGPVLKPEEESSTRFAFDSRQPLVKILLGDEIVESFYVAEHMLTEGRNCIVFNNLYETWMIVERWQADRLCTCEAVEPESSTMIEEYPDDAHEAALRSVEEHGSDMSRPMLIEFSVAVPNEEVAHRVAKVVSSHGFSPEVSYDDESGSWSVYCGKQMLATYEGIVTVQNDLNELLAPYGGYCDGWGTGGNKDENPLSLIP